MKKQIRKAMLCTIAMMVAAIVSLTGVTYAWFSESNEATVDGIKMDVISKDGGVYISKQPYPATFDTSVSIEESEIFQGKHNASSTAGLLNADGTMKFFNGTIESPTDKTLNIESVSEDGNYFEQNIYFDNSTGGKDITISLAGTEILPTDGKRTDLAARIAIVVHGSITIDDFVAQKDYPVAKNGTVDAPAMFKGYPVVQIYEPNATTHIPAGITEYQKNINPEKGQGDEFIYYGLNNTGTDVNRFGEGSPSQLTLVNTVKKAEDVKFVVPMGEYLKITVYVWLEGQDADCQNNISGKPYEAAIKFTLV